jgi:hypothetical protein
MRENLREITNAEEIADFLRDQLGLYYCDDCLNEEVKAGSRSQVKRIMRMFLTILQDYDQGSGCDSCARKKMTIAYLPRLWTCPAAFQA